MTINREHKSLDPTTKQGFQKGKLCLIQLVLVTGQGSSFTAQRIPIAQFFLSYWEQTNDLHSSTWITESGRKKMSVSFSLGFIQYFLHYLSMLPSWRPENSTWRKSASQFPPKVQIAALMAVFYLSLFFLWAKLEIEQGCLCSIMNHYGSGSW